MGVFCLSDWIFCQEKQVMRNICLSDVDTSLLKNVRHLSLTSFFGSPHLDNMQNQGNLSFMRQTVLEDPHCVNFD